jgi:hypothetical protein
MAMVIHPFTQPGQYRGTVLQHGEAVAEFVFVVDEQSEVMQLDIDLATINRRARTPAGALDCDCTAGSAVAHVVSPKGYVLFHASSDAGYSVSTKAAKGEASFDSSKLDKGDLFAVTLLEPGLYVAKNTPGKAQADIDVSLPTDLTKRLTTMDVATIAFDGNDFNPKRLQVTSTQGLVFQINGRGRIVIDKSQSGVTEAGRDPSPKAAWRKFNPPSKREAKGQ